MVGNDELLFVGNRAYNNNRLSEIGKIEISNHFVTNKYWYW